MATTRILTIHPNKGKSIAAVLALLTDYLQNPHKTVNKTIVAASDKAVQDTIANSADYVQDPSKTKIGELVKTYACNPRTVPEVMKV